MCPSESAGSSEEGGTPKASAPAYYCMACPETFMNAASSNAHHDATGHNQTWKPAQSFAERQKRAASIPLPREEGPTPEPRISSWAALALNRMRRSDVDDATKDSAETALARHIGTLEALVRCSARVSHPAGAPTPNEIATLLDAVVRESRSCLCVDGHEVGCRYVAARVKLLAACRAHPTGAPDTATVERIVNAWSASLLLPDDLTDDDSQADLDHAAISDRYRELKSNAPSFASAMLQARREFVASVLAAARSQGGREGTE